MFSYLKIILPFGDMLFLLARKNDVNLPLNKYR